MFSIPKPKFNLFPRRRGSGESSSSSSSEKRPLISQPMPLPSQNTMHPSDFVTLSDLRQNLDSRGSSRSQSSHKSSRNKSLPPLPTDSTPNTPARSGSRRRRLRNGFVRFIDDASTLIGSSSPATPSESPLKPVISSPMDPDALSFYQHHKNPPLRPTGEAKDVSNVTAPIHTVPIHTTRVKPNPLSRAHRSVYNMIEQITPPLPEEPEPVPTLSPQPKQSPLTRTISDLQRSATQRSAAEKFLAPEVQDGLVAKKGGRRQEDSGLGLGTPRADTRAPREEKWYPFSSSYKADKIAAAAGPFHCKLCGRAEARDPGAGLCTLCHGLAFATPAPPSLGIHPAFMVHRSLTPKPTLVDIPRRKAVPPPSSYYPDDEELPAGAAPPVPRIPTAYASQPAPVVELFPSADAHNLFDPLHPAFFDRQNAWFADAPPSPPPKDAEYLRRHPEVVDEPHPLAGSMTFGPRGREGARGETGEWRPEKRWSCASDEEEEPVEPVDMLEVPEKAFESPGLRRVAEWIEESAIPSYYFGVPGEGLPTTPRPRGR